MNRALRNCTWNADLYIEKIHLSEEANVAKADVTNIAQQAFEATNTDVKGHLKVWLEYLSYVKRNTNVNDEKEIEILRKTMELGLETLSRLSADEHLQFDQLCARIEYGPLQDSENGYEHYETVMKNYDNRNKASLWIEFAHLNLSSKSDDGIDVARG